MHTRSLKAITQSPPDKFKEGDMVAAHINDFGLELTENSKVGWAFSLPRKETCINFTDICWQLCYGRGIRYQSETQKEKRQRNYRTVLFLLENGGPELLAENLIDLVDRARPVDWLAAKIAGQPTRLPFTLRLQDVGDFFSVPYAAAWILTIQKRPQCKFWFYTRSFLDPDLFEELSKLAALPNCQGWLSLDAENFSQGIAAFCKKPGVWKLALLQDDQDSLPLELLPKIEPQVSAGNIVNFPYHAGGYHVEPIKDECVTTCPQVVGAYPLERSRLKLKPCQACTFCLP